MAEQIGREETGLAPRPWAEERLAGWMADGNGAPMMVVRGDPGTGKSSLLRQFATRLPEPELLGRISRAPDEVDPFDSVTLLGSVIDRLTNLGVDADERIEMPRSSGITVNMQVDEVQSGGVAIGNVIKLTTAGGLLPVAERLVRNVAPTRRLLIAVDALDQAEDEGAEEFLSILAALMRAATGTGVRLVCASRRELPAVFDDSHAASFDLIVDAPPENDDLRDFLEGVFGDLEDEDRERVVGAILRGAESNWLWAATNADSLRTEIALEGHVPGQIQMTAGLAGLYRDGVRRIKRKLDSSWVPFGRQLLTTLSCAADEHLTITELRWITGESSTRVEDVAHACEPFLRRSEDGVRLFHPDFARWILADNLEGVSEGDGHLAVARGFAELGRETRWSAVAENAASRVVDHWCWVLVLDPFSPSAREHEDELWAILTDPDWVMQARIGVDGIEQAALVAPTLRFPASTLPLSTGLRALQDSAAAEMLVGHEIVAGLTDEQIDRYEAVMDSPALAMRWLEEEVGDYASIAMRTLWGRVLKGQIEVKPVEGELKAVVAPDFTIAALADVDASDFLWLTELYDEVELERLGELIEGVRKAVEDAAESPDILSVRWALLGTAYKKRALRRERSDRARMEDLQQALVAYRGALDSIPPDEDEHWRMHVINLVNTLRDLHYRDDDELDELIEWQRKLVELRREADDGQWPYSSNLLGDAYRERSDREQRAEEARDEDRRLAVDAYREALAGTPPGKPRRLALLIDYANMLLHLEHRSDEQLDELIGAQRELAEQRREVGDPHWPQAANLLGQALSARARRREQGNAERDAESQSALRQFREALAATPIDSPQRLEFAMDLADALIGLAERSETEIVELIAVQAEVVEARRAAEHPDLPIALSLLGDAFSELAARRIADDRNADGELRRALTAYRSALVPSSGDRDLRRGLVVKAARSLAGLSRLSPAEADWLVEHREEARSFEEPGEKSWRAAVNLLGDAYARRAESRERSDPARMEDLELAVETYREALEATSREDEHRRTFVIDFVNALRELEYRDEEQLGELIEAQAELLQMRRAAGHGEWPFSSSLLGDAYAERADRRPPDDEGRARDLHAALDAYEEAIDAIDAEDARRHNVLVNLANTLRKTEQRSPQQLDRMIEAQQELLDRFWQARDPKWAQVANLLGDAYLERAGHKEGEAAEADRREAVAAYREAFAGTPANSERRLVFAADFATSLMELDERSNSELVELVMVQREVVARRRAAGEVEWPLAANLLGDAHREHASRFQDERSIRDRDLDHALEAYREAVAATPPDSPHRLTMLIDVADTLRLQRGRRSASDLDELIATLEEVVGMRDALKPEEWARSSNQLGSAYAERARQQGDDAARAADLDRAVDAYRRALDATPADGKDRLGHAIDLANTVVVHAAATRQGSSGTLEEATAIVTAAVGARDQLAMIRLLPVLRSAFRKHDRWQA